MGNAYCEIAFKTIKTYLETGKVIDLPKDVPAELKTKKAGVFVSLHLKNGDLRGCIGTFLPTRKCLGEEIIRNAISAATEDPRFMPVTESELDDLDISVDVLSKPEKCKIVDLDPKKYGVIVTCGSRRGLLLPDLEGVDTVKEQLKIACSKAGIDYANEKFEVSRFTVERFH